MRQWRRATVATPGEWQCDVRRLAVANGPNIFQMLLVGPILWGHSGPLCHALSLSSSLLLWTSMRRRRATVAACDSSDTW